MRGRGRERERASERERKKDREIKRDIERKRIILIRLCTEIVFTIMSLPIIVFDNEVLCALPSFIQIDFTFVRFFITAR